MADARDEVVRKLADASSGWNAVAVGAAGRPGLALKAANEQNAVAKPWATASSTTAIATSLRSVRFQ
jgi:hypothetical protein